MVGDVPPLEHTVGAGHVVWQLVLELNQLVSWLWVVGSGVGGGKIQGVLGETLIRGVTWIWTQVELERSTQTRGHLYFYINSLQRDKSLASL